MFPTEVNATIDPSASVTTDNLKNIKDIKGLIDWIKQRNPNSNEAFFDISNIRIAVNQEYVDIDHPVQAGDEIAFFPPVTGG